MDREEERYWDPRRSISHERKEELTERGHLMNSGAHWDENPSQMYSSRVSDCTRYRPMQESVSSVHGVYTHGNGGKYHQEGRGMYNQDPSQRVYAEKGHVCDAYEAMDPRRKQLTPHYTAGDRKRPITISREEEEIRFLRRAHFAPPSSTALYHRRTNVLDTESPLNHSTGSGYVDCRAPTPPPFLSQHGSTKRLIPTHSQQKMSAIPTKNISISPENTAVGQEVTSSPRTATSNTNTNKRSRYLRDTDRMSIIQRIENGEKQADLAREFGVTRAAICHINKNREEILTRYDRLVKSAYEIEMKQGDKDAFQMKTTIYVHEIRTHPMLSLRSRLRNPQISTIVYRRLADRIITLLLEEAVVAIGTKESEIEVTPGEVITIRESDRLPCAISLSEGTCPLLEKFHVLEPDAEIGSISFKGSEVDLIQVSPAITKYNIFLLDPIISNADIFIQTIEAICKLGVAQNAICLAALVISDESIEAICSQYPKVTIVTGIIAASEDFRNSSSGFEDFLKRYNGEEVPRKNQTEVAT